MKNLIIKSTALIAAIVFFGVAHAQVAMPFKYGYRYGEAITPNPDMAITEGCLITFRIPAHTFDPTERLHHPKSVVQVKEKTVTFTYTSITYLGFSNNVMTVVTSEGRYTIFVKDEDQRDFKRWARDCQPGNSNYRFR